MSTAEESPILIPSEDEEEDGDEVQYIKEEKAPPITIDETDEQDDVIFVSTCPPPPPSLTPSWDDALAMDLDSFTLPSPTPTTTCAGDMGPMSGGSSLPRSFCPVSALLDSSTPPTLPISTTPVVAVADSVDQDKLALPVFATDLTLGSRSDLSITDSSSSLTALSGASLSLTSDLTSLSDSDDLTLPSVSGSLSGLSRNCPSSRTLGDSKSVLTSEASQTVLSFHATAANPLDLSQHDKASQRKKKVMHSAFPASLEVLHSSSDEDSSCSDDSYHSDDDHHPRNSDLANSDDPDNSDDAEKSDDAENSDDDCHSDDLSEEDEDLGKACLPGMAVGMQAKSAGTGVNPVTALSSPLTPPPLLSNWLDLAISSTPGTGQLNSLPSSSSAASASSGGVQVGLNGTSKVTPPLLVSSVIDKCRDSRIVGASPSFSSSSNQASFSFSTQVLGHGQLVPPASNGTPSSSSVALSQTTPSLDAGSVAPALPSGLASSGLSSQGLAVSSQHAGVSSSQSGSGIPQASVSQLGLGGAGVGGKVATSWSNTSSTSSTSTKSAPVDPLGLLGAADVQQVVGASAHSPKSSCSGGGGGLQGPSSGGRDSLDFLDKLFDDCSSILSTMISNSSSTLPSTSVSSMVGGDSAQSSTAVAKVTVTCSPGPSTVTLSDLASISSAGQRGCKRASTTSLSSLDAASLPPRKRVLKNTTSFTPPKHPTSVGYQPCSLSSSASAPSLSHSTSFPPVSSQSSSKDKDSPADTSSLAARWMLWRDDGSAAGSSKTGQDAAGKDTTKVNSEAEKVCGQCGNKEGGEGKEKCHLSHCTAGHVACGNCLLMQARRILSGKQKESLKCIDASCTGYYPMNELKKSLPILIVEILQDRHDQEFVDFLDNLNKTAEDDAEIKKAQAKKAESKKSESGKPGKTGCRKKSNLSLICNLFDNSNFDADDESEEDEEDERKNREKDGDSLDYWMTGMKDTAAGGSSSKRARTSSNDDQKPSDFPEHWTPMDNSKNLVEVVAVPLQPDSNEYIQVALRFHDHMKFPETDITRIVRIQNPYLWKSYSLKKEQMIQENGGRVVNENQLFHGTKVSTIDAICRRGFDWRFCGKHGTAFGQGCYFAGDSTYSNAYTDRGPAATSSSVVLKSMLQLTPSSDPSSCTVFPHDLSSLHTPNLRVPQTGGGGGSSSGANSSGGDKLGMTMRKLPLKLLPLLKGKEGSQNALIAHLLKAKTDKQLRAAFAGTYGGPRPGSSGSRPVPGGLMYGPAGSGPPAGPSAGTSLFGSGRGGPSSHPAPAGPPPPPSTPQHPRAAPSGRPAASSSSHSSVQPPSHRQAPYSHHRYSLIPGHHSRSHPTPTPSTVPSPFPPPQGLPPPSQAPLHSTSVAPPQNPALGGFRGMGKSMLYPPSLPKKFRNCPAFGGSGMGKGSALMAPTASPQGSGGQGGGVMVPLGSYPSSLSVATTSVTLSGGGGAVTFSGGGGGATPSVALLNANLPPNSYVLVAPLPPNPVPLPPLAPLPPPPLSLLSQPSGLAAAKGGPGWPSASSASGQALDLRKAGSCPRYMFLAKVLTGISTGGQSDFRRPPPLEPSDPLGRCYDSCVDNIHTPRIWVVFDSTQAYPEYVIEYVVHSDQYR